jgi:hypothetical protein
MRRLAAVAALASMAAMASPDGLAPPLSSALGELDRNAYRCMSQARMTICRLSETGALVIADVPALARTLVYGDGRLERVSTTVDIVHFDRLRQRLATQLGPGEQTTERLRAGMSGALPNLLIVWRLEGRRVLLEQHFERITQSGVSVMTPGAFDALMEDRSRRTVRGMRDF